MNCDVTLTAKEFSQLHNALWALDSVQTPVVDDLVTKIREALAGAYKQDEDDFNRKLEHYNLIRDELCLRSSWSMFEVDNLGAPHPFKGVTKLVYRNHSGKCAVYRDIQGTTWADLYCAADLAIADSEDNHHVLIEDFQLKGDTLELVTGS